jgi:putative methionine-R-sulfoxide reductase with GAF domain
VSEGPVDAIERILGETEDADDVLRGAVGALVSDPEIAWAGFSFLEDGALALGPEAGVPDETRRTRVPITFQHALVGELWADGSPDRALLEHVASLVAAHVLIGWDTGGDAWEP